MTYRVGNHYGMHVYEGERWVASFVDPTEAAKFVAAANGVQRVEALATAWLAYNPEDQWAKKLAATLAGETEDAATARQQFHICCELCDWSIRGQVGDPIEILAGWQFDGRHWFCPNDATPIKPSGSAS